MRRWNEYAVLDALRDAEPRRISELVQATGMTPASLGEVVRSLVDKHWVTMLDPVPGGMGRPAQLYSLTIPQGCIIGVDIGRHAVRVIALDIMRTELARCERDVVPGSGVAGLKTALWEALASCMTDLPGPVWLTALSVSGVVDAQGYLLGSRALPDWIGLQVAAELADLLPSRAFAIGRSRAVLFAEHEIGVAQGASDFLLIQFSGHPALGLFLNGRTHPGSRGAAGNLDWSKIMPQPGQTGWIEPFLDAPEPLRAAVEAGLTGDEEVLQGVTNTVLEYVPVIAVTSSLVDPEIVVLGGALTPLLPNVLERATAAFAENTQFAPPLVVSTLDRFGAAAGAALMGSRLVIDMLSDPNEGVFPLDFESFQRQPLPLS